MNKQYIFVTVLISLYFSWVLSFPYFGKAFQPFAELLGVDNSQLTMVFILFHAAGFLIGGFFLKQLNLWKRLIIHTSDPAGLEYIVDISTSKIMVVGICTNRFGVFIIYFWLERNLQHIYYRRKNKALRIWPFYS